MKQGFIVDEESGEIVTEINEGDSVRITRKESIDHLKGTVQVNKDEPFIKVYTKGLFNLSRVLTGTESQFVNYLIQHIRYTSGILAYINGIKLTRQSMSDDTGLSVKTIDKILTSLIDKQVLGKHKTGHDITFVVNPFIFMRGDRINDTLFNLFKNTRWAR